MGHHNVVSILLKHGAMAYDGVLAAGFNGRDKVMQLLLESGAHQQRHLALLASSIGGHSSTVTIILQGMDTLPSYSREIAFSMIQDHNCGIKDPGYLAATLKLMETIEEDNPKHDGILAQFWSPLLISTMLGRDNVVEVLLKGNHIAGQDVGEWEVALLIATVVGFSSIVDLLLDYWNDGARLEISVVRGSGTQHNLLINRILKKMLARRDPFVRKQEALQTAIKAGNEEIRVMIEAYDVQGK
ncbi:Ankyrin repeat and KH domain-containing protein mask [Metarhizium anisopliae]